MERTAEETAVKNGTECAYPIESSSCAPQFGLTKRELFAKDIFCSLINGADRHSQSGDCQDWNYEHLSEIAVFATDALLLELAK